MTNDGYQECEEPVLQNTETHSDYGSTLIKKQFRFLRRVCRKLPVLFVVALLYGSLSFLAGCDSQRPAPKSSSSTPELKKAILSDDKICKAGIAKIFSKDPAIINIDSKNGEVVYLSYLRPDDQKEWKYKCKVSGNRIIWGADNGRWRDSPADSVVSYEFSDDYISVTDRFGDGSSSNEIFFFVQL